MKDEDTISPCLDLLHACVFFKSSNTESLLNEYHSVSLYKSHLNQLQVDVKCAEDMPKFSNFFLKLTFKISLPYLDTT